MADTFESYARRLDKLNRSLSGPDMEKLLATVGMAAKKDAAEAVAGDLGDHSMSHWRRGAPIPIEARFDVVSDNVVEVTPSKRTRGPWRVLEEGRKGGAATDLVQVGRRRKDGTRRGKSRGRNQGATSGKATWSDGEALMASRTPGRVNDEWQKALRSAFG